MRRRLNGIDDSARVVRMDAGRAALDAAREREGDEPPQAANMRYYIESDGRIYWLKDEDERVQLANFTAQIVEDVELIDGSGQTKRQFVINGSLGRATVPAEQFDSLKWVAPQYGSRAIIAPGITARRHLPAAIQTLSGDDITVRRQVYTHTGWRKIDGKWCYLHAGGAIGRKNVATQLDGPLAEFKLPKVSPEALAEAVQASLALLGIGRHAVTYPLYAASWRAPLAEFAPIGCSLILVGETGVFKTAIARLAQAHWGTGWLERDPVNWHWTANALERVAFVAKDAVLLIDDLRPGEDKRLHGSADRMLRGAANRGGRGRMSADTTMRPEYYPRGMIITTAEDLPPGFSLNARIDVVQMCKRDIDPAKLSQAQADAADGIFAIAMSGYIEWLAGVDKASFRRRLDELRVEARIRGEGHRRTSDNAADLALGIDTFLNFAVAAGAISQEQAEAHWETAWNALWHGTEQQAQQLQEQNPVQQFTELLAAAIRSGRAHLDDANRGSRDVRKDAEGNLLPGFRPTLAGWRHREVHTSHGDNVDWAPQTGSKQVGWLDGDDVLLDPFAAYTAAQQMAREAGTTLPLGANTLWRRVKDARLLLKFDAGRQRSTIRRIINGQSVAVLMMDGRRLLGGSGDRATTPSR